MDPLEEVYRNRTNRDRSGTIPDEWNHELLKRDLESLINHGLVERMTNVREIAPFEREKIWYKEIATGHLYVYVAAWERGGPEFRMDADTIGTGSILIQ